MVAFPDILTIRPLNPLSESIAFKTLTSEYENSGESAKQKRLFPLRAYQLKYQRKSVADARTLWQFFMARKGKGEPFNVFLPFANTYVGEYIGTTDGITTIFSLPSKLASGYTIYRAGVALAGGGVDYTFTAGGGEDGADKLTLTAAGTAGQYLTMDFTGNLKVRCRFADDAMGFETFYNRLMNFGIPLKGLLNA